MTDKQNPSFTRYYGLPNGAAKAYFVCQKYLNNGQNALFVSSADTDDFDNAAHEFAPRGAQVFHLPETDTGRLNALYSLLAPASGPRLFSTSYEMLHTPLPDPKEFKDRLFVVHRGDTMRRQELLDRLEAAGYTREDYAETPGQYAARGSVVDIFCLNRPEPLRLYFAGNRVDVISSFDLDTRGGRVSMVFETNIAAISKMDPSRLAGIRDRVLSGRWSSLAVLMRERNPMSNRAGVLTTVTVDGGMGVTLTYRNPNGRVEDVRLGGDWLPEVRPQSDVSVRR